MTRAKSLLSHRAALFSKNKKLKNINKAPPKLGLLTCLTACLARSSPKHFGLDSKPCWLAGPEMLTQLLNALDSDIGKPSMIIRADITTIP